MNLLEVLENFLVEKRRSNDISNTFFHLGNTYSYWGTIVYSILVNVSRNCDIRIVDISNIELMRQSTLSSLIYEIPECVLVDEATKSKIKRLIRDELAKYHGIKTVDEFNKKYRVDIVNRQIFICDKMKANEN